MKVKLTTAFATVLTCLALSNQVKAQSSVTTDTLTDGYTMKGDSLTGIDTRTSLEDFSKFFPAATSSTTVNTASPLNQQFDLPSNLPLILQPAQTGIDNDGLQLQVDLQGVGGGNEQSGK